MREIQRVVQHEIAHNFGIGEAKIREIEKGHRIRGGADKKGDSEV